MTVNVESMLQYVPSCRKYIEKRDCSCIRYTCTEQRDSYVEIVLKGVTVYIEGIMKYVTDLM